MISPRPSSKQGKVTNRWWMRAKLACPGDPQLGAWDSLPVSGRLGKHETSVLPIPLPEQGTPKGGRRESGGAG